MEKAIENLNKTMDKREDMITFIMHTKQNMSYVAYDRLYDKMEQRSFKSLKTTYDSLVKKILQK